MQNKWEIDHSMSETIENFSFSISFYISILVDFGW